MYQGKPETCSNIEWHRPASIINREEEELMQKCARALPSATDPMEKLRLMCLAKGASGILELGRFPKDEFTKKTMTNITILLFIWVIIWYNLLLL